MTDAKRPRIRKIAIAAVLITALAVAGYFYLYHEHAAASFLQTSGVIEATEVELSPKTAGTIVWMCCKEGDFVKANQAAFKLDSRELNARIDEAKAAVASSDETYKEAVILLENAHANHDAAVYEAESAKSETVRLTAVTRDSLDNLNRSKGLFKDGYVARRDLDAAETLYNSNNALLSSAKARVKSAESLKRVSAVNVKAAQARINAAAAKKAEAEASVKVLMTQLADADIASPIDGVVVHKAFEAGEVVSSATSVYTVYDLKDIWVRADVPETDAARIHLNMRAEVTAPGLPDKAFNATVTEAGYVGEFATLKDVTRGRQDIKTFRVKAAIPQGNGLLKPGMSVMVKFFYD